MLRSTIGNGDIMALHLCGSTGELAMRWARAENLWRSQVGEAHTVIFGGKMLRGVAGKTPRLAHVPFKPSVCCVADLPWGPPLSQGGFQQTLHGRHLY
jgi:hypothetical protein